MSTVVESCWHGKISSTEAEHRLMATNKAKAYLVRESDVRSNRLLLSYVSDKDRGLFKHLFVPTLSARKAYSSPNEAFSVMERMILTSEHCGDPVPPQVPDENRNNLSDMSADDGPASDLACHACDFVSEDKEKLRKHHQTHFVIECEDCHKFIGKGSYSRHVQKCKNSPRKVLSCAQCDYKTNRPKCLREHKKRVHVYIIKE